MVRKRKRRNRSIHPVLCDAYGNQAFNLKDAVLSLLASSPSICSGDDVILRPDDPISYRQLLTLAVCAVSGAPPPGPDHSSFPQLSQRQIVRKTMVWMLDSSLSNDNMLCKSYDSKSGTSLSGEMLCSSDWSLLLDRIGFSVMEVLLRHYSIFVPSINPKGFIQVTGTPLTKSLTNSKASSQGSSAQNKKTRDKIAKRIISPSCVDNEGNKNKRKRDVFAKSAESQSSPSRHLVPCMQFKAGLAHDGENKRKRDEIAKCANSQLSSLSMNLVSCTQLKTPVTHDGEIKRKRDEIAKCANSEPSNLVCSIEKKTNRKRLYSWQRRKQRKMDSQIGRGDLGISFGTSENNIMPECQHEKEKCGTSCFYCFILHCTRKVPVNTQIKRRNIFYNKSSSKSLFPKSHIINRLKPNDSGALSLMKGIFGNDGGYSNFAQCNSCGDSSASRSNCLYHSFLALFKSLITNAHRCRHKMLLHKHCYVHQQVGNLNSNLESPDSFSKHQEVVAFIFAILRNIVPPSLLGNKQSWRALRKNIWYFVKLRRYENFTVEDCLTGLRVSHFEFLLKLESSNCKKMKKKLRGGKKSVSIKSLLHTWIYWLFSHVIIPVISSSFYATERETKRHDVFYYKKPVWINIVKGTITSLKKKTLRVLDRSSLMKLLASKNRSFGFSRVRFFPKEETLRPLANLKRTSKLRFFSEKLKKKVVSSYQPVNSSLNELSIILINIKVQDANLLGSSVFDYNDAYIKLYNFISKVKNGEISMPKVFIVVADVSKAFDSIDQDVLLKIMEGIIENEEYVVGKYTQIITGKDRFTPIYRGSFGCINSNFSVQFSSNSGVFIDQAYYQRTKKQVLHDLLYQHVKHNILQIGGQFYEQKVGIAQGSILSSLLCSFYFGHLEETLIWPFLKKIETNDTKQAPQSLLMRYLDDFIFISTSEKKAMGFLERVTRGFKNYNCFMNSAKYGCNFEINRGDFVNRQYIGEDGVSFLPWSGLLVNCNTLEIQADYTRYWRTHMRSTITVHRNAEPSDTLKKKLCCYMRPKCHAILYDSKINSSKIVRLNLYQAFLICAMKFHCYICEMLDPVPSPVETIRIIQKTLSYMHNMIHKRMKEMEANYGVHPMLGLKKIETVWLGISAYIRILKKKQSRHKELLCLLRENLENCEISEQISNHLEYVVSDSHSSMFWKIRF